MPVKPRMPATTDTRKKINAHFNNVIGGPFRLSPWRVVKIADVTLAAWTWFQ
jgi:hypothetical protein